MAGRQEQGPEANRLLTLEHADSGTPAQTEDAAAETTASHPCPVLELPPAWPLGCGSKDVPAFCFVCFHREEEEELLEEVPLQRSVPTVGSGWAEQGHRAQAWDPSGPGRLTSQSLGPLLTTHNHLPTPDSQASHLSLPCFSHPGPTATFLSSLLWSCPSCSEPSMAPGSHRRKWTLSWTFKAYGI